MVRSVPIEFKQIRQDHGNGYEWNDEKSQVPKIHKSIYPTDGIFETEAM